MVFVLTLPIKASHLLAPLTGARHHVLEGAEPLAREERSSKRTPRWRREEGEWVRGAEKKEEDEEEVGGGGQPGDPNHSHGGPASATGGVKKC